MRPMGDAATTTNGHILPETPPNWRDHDLLWWTIGLAVLIGYVIPKLLPLIAGWFSTTKQKEEKEGQSHRGARTRQSRLLQQKFGCLMTEDENGRYQHDLQLSVDTQDEVGGHTDADSNKKGAAVVAASEESSSSSEMVEHEEARSVIAASTSTSASSTATTKTAKPSAGAMPQSSSSSSSTPPPQFRNTSDRHPGLDAFRYWWDVQTSLYRIYTLTTTTRRTGTTGTGQGPEPCWSEVPPYNPSSRRGHTSVDLRVTNDTDDETIDVYWINFSGGYEHKGTIMPNGSVWTQSTWIDHPWVFCTSSSSGRDGVDEEKVVAHYIPYKIIPNVVPEAPTVDLTDTDTTGGDEDDEKDVKGKGKMRLIGIHRFAIVKLPQQRDGADHNDGNDKDEPRKRYTHWIRDDILPLSLDIATEQQALELCLLHCVRTGYYHWKTLLLYFTKVQSRPDVAVYRHVRIANPTFADAVWQTAARGVFLATGWVEHGAYLEWGVGDRPFPRPDDITRIVKTIERWWRRAEDAAFGADQPEGADGYGRAGFR